MKRIVVQTAAVSDISAIQDFIGRESKNAANQVATAIMTGISQLSVFPRTGRLGRVKGTHELVVRGLPYLVVYVIGADRVEIIAIVHTARQRPKRTIR